MIYWMLQASTAHPDLARGLPPAGVLSAAEQAEYAALRIEKRRRDWLLGRWTAKRLVQAVPFGGASLSLGSIRLTPAKGHAPQAIWPGCSRPWNVSISHCRGRAVAAMADAPEASLGVDLERVEARVPGFADDFLTLAEIEQLRRAPAHEAERLTAIWCAKEAALKALGVGLTVDTRSVYAALDDAGPAVDGWRHLLVTSDAARWTMPAGQPLWGWWRRHGCDMMAIVGGDAMEGWPVEVQLPWEAERLV